MNALEQKVCEEGEGQGDRGCGDDYDPEPSSLCLGKRQNDLGEPFLGDPGGACFRVGEDIDGWDGVMGEDPVATGECHSASASFSKPDGLAISRTLNSASPRTMQRRKAPSASFPVTRSASLPITSFAPPSVDGCGRRACLS